MAVLCDETAGAYQPFAPAVLSMLVNTLVPAVLTVHTLFAFPVLMVTTRSLFMLL